MLDLELELMVKLELKLELELELEVEMEVKLEVEMQARMYFPPEFRQNSLNYLFLLSHRPEQGKMTDRNH